MSDPVGQVSALWVFPVKSMQGQRVEQASIGPGGLVGDREWSVFDADTDEALTAKQAPTLREVTARLLDSGALTLDIPGQPAGLTGAAAEAALSAHLGRRVRLVRATDSRGFVDVAAVHLVSAGSIADAAHAESCDACDVEEPRANVVLTLSEPGPTERSWLDAELHLGQARLRVSKLPKHCLGVYAEVLAEGTAAVGDGVGVTRG